MPMTLRVTFTHTNLTTNTTFARFAGEVDAPHQTYSFNAVGEAIPKFGLNIIATYRFPTSPTTHLLFLLIPPIKFESSHDIPNCVRNLEYLLR
ncbi:hypothetical protein AX16_005801 [Volvariella volvacea WC 439]|nr:hypothetical protein AX16_005801 [Volvariella volvacea WC 439]